MSWLEKEKCLICGDKLSKEKGFSIIKDDPYGPVKGFHCQKHTNFDQPERSKREDYCERCGHTSKECFSLMCTCNWKSRCGALNIVET